MQLSNLSQVFGYLADPNPVVIPAAVKNPVHDPLYEAMERNEDARQNQHQNRVN